MTLDHEAQIRDLLEEAWDEGFERGAQEQGTGQGLALVRNPYRDATHALPLAKARTARDDDHANEGDMR